MKKNISQKTYFFPFVTPRTYSIKFTANQGAQLDSEDPGLSFGYLTILLASIVIEIIATFCENSPILRKFDLFWPRDLKFDLIKNLSIFSRTCCWYIRLPIERRLPLFAILVFELSEGGRSSAPPPPAVRRWLRPPAVRGLKEIWTKT